MSDQLNDSSLQKITSPLYLRLRLLVDPRYTANDWIAHNISSMLHVGSYTYLGICYDEMVHESEAIGTPHPPFSLDDWQASCRGIIRQRGWVQWFAWRLFHTFGELPTIDEHEIQLKVNELRRQRRSSPRALIT